LAVSGINIWERICSLLNRWRNHLWAEPCTFNLEYHCVPFVKERGKEKGKENGKRRKRKGKDPEHSPKRTCRIPLLLPFGARTLALGFEVRTTLTL
jgi:hypothetical protein